MAYRLIVTGCRDWTDRKAIAEALERLLTIEEPIVVHGACPTGADQIADEWCAHRWVKTEPHPAQWQRPDGSTDRGAGFARNAEMAKAGADYCIAFWDARSPGTLHMITQAVAHGIGVRIVPAVAR